MTKKKFFIQGALLTAVSLFLRVTNISYRSYLTKTIGSDGMGLYQLIFSVFMLAVTLSTSGISLAVTRIISARIASGEREKICSSVFRCLMFCMGLSLVISLSFFLFSDFAADVLLGNPKASGCLKILGLGLPFMSLSTCLKGYFLAVDESLSTAAADMLEQIVTIGATVMIFDLCAPSGLENSCLAAMTAATIGEAVSFLCGIFTYKKSLCKNTPRLKKKACGIMRDLSHIALPCTLSSAARSLLSTGENLLIPKELQHYGLSYRVSMSSYGVLHGMSMPMLYFPSSFLYSFASLLIPRIARERDKNHDRAVSYITGRAVSCSFVFGFFFSAVFFVFGENWGEAFFSSAEAGRYLRVLAPIVPLIYLDVVVDSLLKGLDEQLNSMKYNLLDSSLRVCAVLAFMRFFGMQSYLAILMFSTIFNATLSLGRLLKASGVRLVVFGNIFLPSILAALSVAVSWVLFRHVVIENQILLVLSQLLAAMALFAVLLVVSGCGEKMFSNAPSRQKKNPGIQNRSSYEKSKSLKS